MWKYNKNQKEQKRKEKQNSWTKGKIILRMLFVGDILDAYRKITISLINLMKKLILKYFFSVSYSLWCFVSYISVSDECELFSFRTFGNARRENGWRKNKKLKKIHAIFIAPTLTILLFDTQRTQNTIQLFFFFRTDCSFYSIENMIW